MVDLTEAFTWRNVLPVVVQFFADNPEGTSAGAISAVQNIADKDYPSQANRMLKSGSAVEDRTRWAMWHGRIMGFIEKVAYGKWSATAEGRAWLAENPYPLSTEQRSEIGRLTAIAEKEAKRESNQDVEEALPVEDADFFWIIRAGKHGEQEQEALNENLGIPGLDFGHHANTSESRENFIEILLNEQPDTSRSTATNFASQLFRFKNEMQPGDLVLMPSKLEPGTIHYGRIAGGYEYRADAPQFFRHVRPINWSAQTIQRSEIGDDLKKSLSSMLTVCTVSRNNALERIESVIQGDGDPEFDQFTVAPQQAKPTFDWKPFFNQLAVKLLRYKDNREELMEVLHSAAEESERPSLFKHLWVWWAKDGKESATDFDPFVILGTPNRQITWSNKEAICAGLKSAFNIEAPVPKDFTALPQINNQNSRYESAYTDVGNTPFYDGIWNLLEAAHRYSSNPSDQSRQSFITAFDIATNDRAIGKYTMALFWAFPDTFLALDNVNSSFLEQDSVLGYKINRSGLTGHEYLTILDDTQQWLEQADVEPADFSGLSYAAYQATRQEPEAASASAPSEASAGDTTYSVESLIEKGCFVPKPDIQLMLSRLREKKNLILQGAPGTGKTWIARELAKILCQSDAPESITAVQFHPSMSYEDFVQGFRPGDDGRLVRARGPFLAAVDKALDDSVQTTDLVTPW